MKILASTALLLVGCLSMNAGTKTKAKQTDPQATTVVAEPTDSVTMAVAVSLGSFIKPDLDNLNQMGISIDYDAFARVLSQALQGKDAGMTVEQANDLLTAEVNRQHMRADSVEMAKQKQFLARAAVADGAIKLPSGVIMQVLIEGEGVSPTPDNTVVVRYVGKLADGTVFDDATQEAVELPVSHLIPGFTEGLTHMKPGGTYRLVIPSDQAYGPEGAGGVIPPNAALDFTITLDMIK